jgi:hypothetical protein
MAETLSPPQPEQLPDYWAEDEPTAQARLQSGIEQSVAEQEASEHWRPQPAKDIPAPEIGPNDHWAPQPAGEVPAAPEPRLDDYWAEEDEPTAQARLQSGIEQSVAEQEASEHWRPTELSEIHSAMRAQAREMETRAGEHWRDN